MRLEESVLRFYESEYSEKLPQKILRGDSLLFPSQSVQAFQKIHTEVVSGKTSTEQKTRTFGRVIAITSGKGGVGKSNITLNLAIELQRLGKLCLVLDADMGLANIHLLAGVSPKYDLRDLLSGKACMSDLIVPGPEGIGVIAGANALDEDDILRELLPFIQSFAQLLEGNNRLMIELLALMFQGTCSQDN